MDAAADAPDARPITSPVALTLTSITITAPDPRQLAAFYARLPSAVAPPWPRCNS